MDSETYNAIRKRVEDRWGGCIRDPAFNGGPRLTLEETAVMISPDAESVLSKMAVLKAERSGLAKVKAWMASKGVRSMADVRAPSGEYATPASAILAGDE